MKPDDRDNLLVAVGLLVVVLLFAAGAAAWNEYIYGDWRCAFAHCRLVK